jgi:plastocyanin
LLSPYLRQLDQYGFARLELLRPVLVNAPVPATHTTDDAADIVVSLIRAGAVAPLAAPPDAAIYVVFYPDGTSLVGADACGWHYRVSGAWVAAVEFPDGAGSAALTLDNIMRIFSHELAETITDPDGNAGWVMDRAITGGTEIGDACNNTDDFVAGVFVNAYWSERHKACIIPKPRGYVRASSSVEVIDETVVSNGTVTFHGDPFDIRTCLQGTYAFTNSFVAQRARFSAAASNFRTPTFSWRIMEAKGGPRALPNGFSDTVLLSVDAWSNGPGTSTHALAEVPVHVEVAGDELRVVASDLGTDYVNFSVLVEATAAEGAFTAAALGRQLLACQKFEYDENYKNDLENCRRRLDKLVLQAIQLLPAIDRGDPVRTRVDGVSRWIGGERVTAVAQAASVAAAVEKAHPEVAVQLRGLASVVYQVPAALLATTGLRPRPQRNSSWLPPRSQWAIAARSDLAFGQSARAEIRSSAVRVLGNVTVAQPRLRIALLALALAAAGGMTATIAHGDNPSSTATFKTVDGIEVFQRVQGSGSSTTADIVIGGTVTFTNSSVETHNVDFDASGQGGVSCQQTSGGTASSALRFPNSPTDGSWSGACTFTRAGTYSFMCDEHAGMTGTVVVSDPAAPPGTTTATTPTTTTPTGTIPPGGTPTTTPPATTTPTAERTPTPSSAQTPTGNATALSVTVKLVQRGSSVRGTISGARSSARARITLMARRSALGLAGRAATPVGVGSIGARTTTNGTLAFVVKLNGKARAALARRGRLPVTLLVSAPSVTGTATAKTFKIVMRPLS